MDYAELVAVYDRLYATSKRLEKTTILADAISSAEGDELGELILLLQGRVLPRTEEAKLGVAAKLVLKAIAKASGEDSAGLLRRWKETGDLGEVAEQAMGARSQQTLAQAKLSVKEVYATLRKLPQLQGKGAVERKLDMVAKLLSSAQGREARYLVRTVLEDLRVGVGEGALRDAIVWSVFGEELGLSLEKGKLLLDDRTGYNQHVEAVQQAYDVTSDFAAVATVAREKGLEGLRRQEIVVGRPLKVMLALKASSVADALKRVDTPCQVEYKLDGFRIQVHKDGEGVTLYTRRLEDVTAQFPDVVEAVRGHISAASCILDCEVVGYSPSTKRYLPFQSISQRIRRKYGIAEMARKFPVEIDAFDLLHLEGRSLLGENFQKRREALEGIIQPQALRIVPVHAIVTSEIGDVERLFKESLKAGNEGLMLKALAAPYKPGARVGYMVKLKETLENLDVVIVGAEWGEGKRSGWLSSFTVAVAGDEGELLEIGRVATGLKEKEEEGLSFAEMTRRLEPLIVSEKGRDVKVKPEVVIEVAYEEIQKSPTYSSGYALRFPRVVVLRDDRADITSLEYLEQLYDQQGK